MPTIRSHWVPCRIWHVRCKSREALERLKACSEKPCRKARCSGSEREGAFVRVGRSDFGDLLFWQKLSIHIQRFQADFCFEDPAWNADESGQEKLGADDLSTLTTMNSLATLLTEQGRNREAEPLYREVLQKRMELSCCAEN